MADTWHKTGEGGRFDLVDLDMARGMVVLEMTVRSVSLRADPFDGYVHVVSTGGGLKGDVLAYVRYPAELVPDHARGG